MISLSHLIKLKRTCIGEKWKLSRKMTWWLSSLKIPSTVDIPEQSYLFISYFRFILLS